MCFFNLAEQAYLDQTQPSCTFKNLHCRKNSFQNITQFSQENIVQDATAFNADGFLLRDICVSSTYLNMPIASKMSYHHLETPKLQKVFLSNTNSILKVKPCGRFLSF
jgi:hypothetical protein